MVEGAPWRVWSDGIGFLIRHTRHGASFWGDVCGGALLFGFEDYAGAFEAVDADGEGCWEVDDADVVAFVDGGLGVEVVDVVEG